MNVGIVGCGNISGIYLTNLTGMFSRLVSVRAVADLIPEKAEHARETYGIPEILTLEEMASRPDIDLILNITEPYNHFAVSRAILRGGKHAYSEKPLSITRAEGAELMALAQRRGVWIGGAPDTFLGGGIQTCRKLIDDGWIGEVLSATAFMVGHGHETWHPNPAFYYQRGGGPMFDMGPYYLTALINLVGPVASVSGMTRKGFARRRVTSQPNFGQMIDVEVPTHIAGTMAFENGAVGTIIMSFDVWGSSVPHIEIHGTLGSLAVPDPNTFGGPVRFKRAGGEWQDIPLAYGYQANSRGLGLADMACALREGRPIRASGDVTFHVLDIMEAFHEASDRRCEVDIASTCVRPTPLPLGLADGIL